MTVAAEGASELWSFCCVTPTSGAVTFATFSSQGPIPDLLHTVNCTPESASPYPLVCASMCRAFCRLPFIDRPTVLLGACIAEVYRELYKTACRGRPRAIAANK